MKKIIKYFALSAAVLMSASACAPSADKMVENLKNMGLSLKKHLKVLLIVQGPL